MKAGFKAVFLIRRPMGSPVSPEGTFVSVYLADPGRLWC